MVAEPRYDHMAMNNFIDRISDLEACINPQDQVPVKVTELFKMINTGFQVFHKQVTDIADKIKSDDLQQQISNLDSVTQQINVNLHSLANQVQQSQSSPQQHQQHKKGILEFKVIQNIKPLTGNRSHFRQWHQKLINALSTIKEDHAEVIKTIERSMDVGDKISDALDDLDSTYLLDEVNKDLTCILMDKCEGEAYDKIKGLQNMKGRRFTWSSIDGSQKSQD